jgi:hypothetical protein
MELSCSQYKSRSTPLNREQVNGKPAYRVNPGEEGGKYLAKLDDNGAWQVVDTLTEVSKDELLGSYGIWGDKETTRAGLFFNHVDRPLDGQIQRDEITPFAALATEGKREVLSESIFYTKWRMSTLKDASINLSQTSPNGPFAILQETWD